MTATEGSYLGLAKQTAYETPNVTDAEFKYLLFSEGSASPQNMTVPLDAEIGGGALLRDVVKVGVMSGGGLRIIPRPKTLGLFLYGVTGSVQSAIVEAGPFYTHTFKLPADQFAAPFYTTRFAPGNLWGEQHQDNRVTLLNLEFAGADFLRGTVAMSGGLPKPVATTTWDVASKVDGGAPFLAPLGSIELPTGSEVDVLSGSFSAVSNIPMQEQFVVGRYTPQGLDIVSRAFVFNLNVKIKDDTLYKKMMYDPAGGADWVANIFREGRVTLKFASQAGDELTIVANGQADADANVAWSAQPLGLRAQRQIVMNVSGILLADPLGTNDPLTITLKNQQTAY